MSRFFHSTAGHRAWILPKTCIFGLVLQASTCVPAATAAEPANAGSSARFASRPEATPGVARITELPRSAESAPNPKTEGPTVRMAQAPPRAPAAAGAGGRPIEEVRPGPTVPQAEALPSPFSPDHVRLPLIGAGRTPQLSEATKKKLDTFIDAQLDTEATLNMAIGRPQLLVFKQVPFRIQIADEETAGYTLITERELSIVGKKLGSTVLNLWFTDPQNPQKQEIISYLVTVSPDPEAKERLEQVLQGLEAEVNRNFPDSSVQLSFVGDQVMVRGQAKDVDDATQIIRIVGQNVPSRQSDVPATLPGEQQLPPGAGANSTNRTLINTGESIDAQNLYEQYKLENEIEQQGLQGNGNVINMLRIAGVQQIMLRVTVAEVDRSATRALGTNLGLGSFTSSPARFAGLFPTVPGAASIAQAVGGGTVPGVTSGALGTGSNFLVNDGDFRLVLNALKQINLARSLNEPNLTTLNGRPATLQVGGSFPIPVTTTQGFNTATLQTVQYVPFGVILRFIPTVVDKDRVRLQVFVTVSDRSATTINVGGGQQGQGGTNVPSNVDTRNFNTVVELREGQTLTAGGLLKTTYSATSQRVPFAADVPVVGRLFANDSNTYTERELMVLVTPYLVSPYEDEETPPVPGSDLYEPDDIEFYVLGRIEGRRPTDYRSSVRTDLQKMQAWRRGQQMFIVGPSGHSDGRP